MKVELVKGGGGYHYIILPEELAQPLYERKVKRVLCRINDQLNVHSALTRSKTRGFSIMLGKRILKQLDVEAGDLLEVEISEDHSPNQFEESVVLKEVLSTDWEAQEIWDKLSPGRKRSLTYLIIQVKSVDKKIERALKIAENIKLGISDPRKVLKG
ncbi:MAG: DUF1905 domain-containing protein [Bacteroidota bacterium]